jgi:hypothetical protein
MGAGRHWTVEPDEHDYPAAEDYLSLLTGPAAAHTLADRLRDGKGKPLSPVLLVRGGLAEGTALTVADGYHRICASHHLTEDADIPCRIVDLPPESVA